MSLIDKYLGESKIPTIDYEKIGPNDWIIYDEGTGTIQKIVKNKANRNIDVSKHFVSSKSAGMKASHAVKKYSWLFLKKNKGFSTLIKTMKHNEARVTGKFMNPADKNQLKILKDTVKNPAKGMFLGGPSAEEAEKILKQKFGYSDAQIKKLKR